MKIIINGRFYSQKLTGVQRYAGELVAQLDLLYDGTDVEIALPPDAERIDKAAAGGRHAFDDEGFPAPADSNVPADIHAALGAAGQQQGGPQKCSYMFHV